MTKRRKYTSKFKAQVVLEIISGAKTQAAIARQHRIKSHLVKAFQNHHDRVQVIRYEDILTSLLEEWQRIFNYLELPFDPESISRYNDVQLRIGDHVDEKYDRLNREPLEKWKSILANPIRKALCRRHLK